MLDDYEIIESLASQMKQVVDSTVWDRGYDYFVGRYVQSMMSEGHLVFARVRGSARNLYTVQLDLEAFRRSHCSCPHDRYCKHLVAVFFALYDSVGDPAEFLLEVFQERSNGGKSIQNSEQIESVSEAKKRRSTKLTQLQKVSVPTEDSSFERWLQYADQEYQTIAGRISTDGYRMDAEIDFIRPLSAIHETWSKPLQALHQLCILVFLAVKGDELAGSAGKVAHGYYAGHLSHRILQTAINAVDAVSRRIVEEAMGDVVSRQQYTEMMVYLRETLLESPATEAPLLVYLTLWIHLARLGADLAAETVTLKMQVSSIPEGYTSRVYGEQALLVLYVLANQDDSAMPLAMAHAKATSTLKIALSALELMGEVDRYVRWLRVFTERSDLFDAGERATFTPFWLTAVQLDPSVAKACEQYLKRYLPRTAHAYDMYLLVSEQYRAWVEERMMRGALPIHADKEALSVVEKADRGSLLPWYHQAIERAIRERNRASYKVAARMMKKLQGHYKKLKQAERFEAYVMDVKSRYSRFRALHEELQKKGLIPS